MSERPHTRVTRDDIGEQGPCQAICDWCLASAIRYKLANADTICEDCADLADELGDGTMLLAMVAQDPRSTEWRCAWDGRARRYQFEPPLRLDLVIEHDDEGYRWLRADPADAHVAALLGLGPQCRTGYDLTLTGADRADLCANVAGWLHFIRESWQGLLDSEPITVDEDQALADRRERAQAQAGLDWCREHVLRIGAADAL